MLFYAMLCYAMLCYAMLYYAILYYTILYYTILYYTILYYTILYYTILYYTILYYTILYYTILYDPILQHDPRRHVGQALSLGSRKRAWTCCLELLELAIGHRLADVASFGACLSWRPELLQRMRQERSGRLFSSARIISNHLFHRK